jgi:glycosyltransferase involved in cell wall biosynthesis
MACGVPVVATDVSDNSYVIPDGRAGYIVPLNDEKTLGDRICQLMLDKERRRMFSLEARIWVAQEFSCKRLAEKTAAVYKEAIQLKQLGI